MLPFRGRSCRIQPSHGVADENAFLLDAEISSQASRLYGESRERNWIGKSKLHSDSTLGMKATEAAVKLMFHCALDIPPLSHRDRPMFTSF